MKKGKVVILSGPSGVGKGTVRGLLDMEKMNMVNSVSMTTRDPREEDIEGVTYYFVTPERFEQAIENDELLEYAGYGKKAYGTPRKMLEEVTARGQNILLEIEVNGARQVMEKIPDAVSIFLVPPQMDDLKSRLEGRGSEKEEEIQTRLDIAKSELEQKDLYDYVVVNDNAERAAREIEDIVLKASGTK